MDFNTHDIKIGDRVCGKRTGELTPATVIGIAPPGLLRIAESDYALWNEYYPEWPNQLIVLGMFDEPHKALSLSDVRKNVEIGIKDTPWKDDLIKYNIIEKIIQHQYDNSKETVIVCYPIEDVEVI